MKQYPPSYLCDVIYGVEPMTRELAVVVRALRVEQRMSYAQVGRELCDHEVDGAVEFQLGQSLSHLAASFLQEPLDRGWI